MYDTTLIRWSKLGVNFYTNSWSRITGAHEDVYGVPQVPLALVVKLEDDPKEDLKEDFEDEEKTRGGLQRGSNG